MGNRLSLDEGEIGQVNIKDDARYAFKCTGEREVVMFSNVEPTEEAIAFACNAVQHQGADGAPINVGMKQSGQPFGSSNSV